MRIKVSDDRDFVNKYRKALADNNGYCLCALVQNEDTKCMCKDFRDKIERREYGFCDCGLYEIVED